MKQSSPLIERLVCTKILAVLDVHHQQRLDQLILLDSVDSTNDYLLAQAKTGSRAVLACFAEEQTAGRGRSAKTWYSPRGINLYGSLLWHFQTTPPRLATLSLAVGVVLVKLLEGYGVTGLRLKWPNDIYCEGRKLAGILIDSVRVGTAQQSVVIGVGINLSGMAQSEWADQAIDLAAVLGHNVQRNALAGSLLNALLSALPRYADAGFDAFLADWQQYDALAGKNVVIRTPHTTHMGVACGVNEHGELLLRDHRGQLNRFHCGEVSVRLDE